MYFHNNPSTDQITTQPIQPSIEDYGILLSDIEPEQLNWLWEKRIPRGKLTILDGDPGLGKSLLTLDLAARVTTGRPMPDGTPGVQGSVVLIAPEDGAADTIKPRVEAAGGDPSHIRLLTFVETRDPTTGQTLMLPFTFSKHFSKLVITISQTLPALVIIDPLMAVLGGINAFHDQKFRETLSILAHLAQRTNCAVLIVRHLNKGSSENPLYRGGGAIGIIAMARTGLLAVQHPSDENKRILVAIKNNLSEKASNLTYQVIANAQGIPSIQWLGTNHYPTASLLRGSTPLSLERQDILKVLQATSHPLGPKELAEQVGQNHTLVRQLLRRMLNAGDIISPAYGLYTTHQPSPETLFSQNNAATPTTPATPATLAIPATPTTPATLTTVSHTHSNFAPPSLSPPPAPSLPINEVASPSPTSFETATEKLRTLLHCFHKNHYLHWTFSVEKIGCPICDSWVRRDATLNPATLALYETFTHYPPYESESRAAWIERIAPSLIDFQG